jgi:hypothetical protein
LLGEYGWPGNSKLFEDRDTLPLKCVVQSLNILSTFPQFQEKHNIRQPTEEVINKYFPWAFFDGASQGTPPRGGAGGILHLSMFHSISFKDGVGQASNNLCELMALKLVLMLAWEHGVTHIQIFGDSLLVIQWMKQELVLRNFMLQPLFLDVMSLQVILHSYFL